MEREERRGKGGQGRHPDLDLSGEASGADDGELATRAIAGDAQALSELFRRYQDLTWRVARVVTGSDDDAVTAVVEVFGHLARLDLSREPAPSFRAALATAVRDAALERMQRRRGVSHPLTGALIGNLVVPPPEADRAETPEDRDTPSTLDLTEAVEPLPLLAHVLPPPPAELWALVRVAWSDARLPPPPPDKTG